MNFWTPFFAIGLLITGKLDSYLKMFNELNNRRTD